jgi:8-oxo-dGTP pyrophosphatase MutT (NUDIX family)
VSASETVLDTARVISVRQDRLRSPADGAEFVRDVVIHPGAVGVVALDDDERVLLVSQYRHPVGHRLFAVPAGLLDVPGEPYRLAAARELYEEGHVRADEWRVLVDLFTSPGMTTESTRIFLARGLTAVADVDRHVGVHEEADMPVSWAPLADVVDAVLAGRLHNPILVSGVLAAWSARSRGGYDALRPADAPWAARDAQAG